MMYHREFTLSSCRFNDGKIYELYYAIMNSHDKPFVVGHDAVKTLLAGIHGHNFKIVVEVDDNFKVGKQNFLVDDHEIEKIVMAWNNTNLSVHPDFMLHNLHLRATTECMAQLLSDKISKLVLRTATRDREFIGPIVRVIVHETDHIWAEATIDCDDLDVDVTLKELESLEVPSVE